MSKQMLELLGKCLESNHINFQINHDREYYMIVNIRDHEGDWVDDLCVVFESEFEDNGYGLPVGEFTYKVLSEAHGTIYRHTSTVDTCEFIKNEIENILDELCY